MSVTPRHYNPPLDVMAVKLLNTFAWVIFFGFGPLLWMSGLRLFLESPLSRPKKIGWSVMLIVLGVAIGGVLPLSAIRNRFLLLAAALPLLAMADVKIARSNRTFSFWFRACAFEVCTVFASAAITRSIVALLGDAR